MIKDFLISKGFTQENNLFKRSQEVVTQQVIINGQAKNQTKKLELCFEYIGDGWIGNDENDNEKLEGYAFSVNDEPNGDFWVRDENELSVFIQL